MAGGLVLLTGGTGFLGFAILLDLLRNGYRVRVAARSQAKIDAVRAAPPISALGLPDTQLMFVIVPDMAASGAYDDAVNGVNYIIHAAAPADLGQEIEKEDLEKVFVTASVEGTLGILESAIHNSKTVRRIIVTSSTVAIAPVEVYTTDIKECEVLRGPENRVAIPTPPYGSALEAYCVGKAAALNATDAFMRDHTTAFDLISIMPSFIFGKDEFVTDTKGLRTGSTLALISGLLAGNQGLAGIGNAVLCTDVARAHVLALDPNVEGNQSFVLNVEAKWEDTAYTAKKYFPDAFKSGLFRESDPQPTILLKWDSSKARDVLGIDLAPYEVMVKEVVGEYLELAKGEGK